jgi:hypothetical protein
MRGAVIMDRGDELPYLERTVDDRGITRESARAAQGEPTPKRLAPLTSTVTLGGYFTNPELLQPNAILLPYLNWSRTLNIFCWPSHSHVVAKR